MTSRLVHSVCGWPVHRGMKTRRGETRWICKGCRTQVDAMDLVTETVGEDDSTQSYRPRAI